MIIENPNKRGHRLTQGESTTWEETGPSIIEGLIDFFDMAQRGRNLYTNFNPHKIQVDFDPSIGGFTRRTVTTPKGHVISRPLLPTQIPDLSESQIENLMENPNLSEEAYESLLDMLLESVGKQPLPELQPLSRVMQDRI
jgi:hypothetical protein|tara:strand:- start:329 stop:748 length:420 start_codon:yes stop_codon:yes gene_type:complete